MIDVKAFLNCLQFLSSWMEYFCMFFPGNLMRHFYHYYFSISRVCKFSYISCFLCILTVVWNANIPLYESESLVQASFFTCAICLFGFVLHVVSQFNLFFFLAASWLIQVSYFIGVAFRLLDAKDWWDLLINVCSFQILLHFPLYCNSDRASRPCVLRIFFKFPFFIYFFLGTSQYSSLFTNFYFSFSLETHFPDKLSQTWRANKLVLV